MAKLQAGYPQAGGLILLKILDTFLIFAEQRRVWLCLQMHSSCNMLESVSDFFPCLFNYFLIIFPPLFRAHTF